MEGGGASVMESRVGEAGNPSDIQLKDVATTTNNGSTGQEGHKRKKKVIYFADGSTMEDYEEDDATDNDTSRHPPVDAKISKSKEAESLQSVPPVDPSKMQWPEWVRHQTNKAGGKTLTILEGMGGTAAYYLGITTPKYQSEIDEYNRMVAKKKSHEEELVSWSTGPKAQSEQPVVQDVKANGTEDAAVVSEK